MVSNWKPNWRHCCRRKSERISYEKRLNLLQTILFLYIHDEAVLLNLVTIAAYFNAHHGIPGMQLKYWHHVQLFSPIRKELRNT